MSRSVTVFVKPYHSITLAEKDLALLLHKLRQIEAALGAFPERADFTAAIAHVESGETSASDVEFKPGEDSAVLRALDELRTEGKTGRALERLRDRLIDYVGSSAVTYQLELQRPGAPIIRSQIFYSWSGPYTVGERLPLLPEGECWEVIEVRAVSDAARGGYETLVCRLCRDQDPSSRA